MERLVANFVKKVVKKFVKNSEKHDLVRFLKGEAALSSVDLEEDSLNKMLMIPQLSVKKVSINKVSAKISLSRIGIDPMVFAIDQLEIVVEEKTELGPRKEKKKKKPKPQTYKLGKRTMDGIRLEVARAQIFIRTLGSNPSSVQNTPPTILLELRNLALYATNGEWKPGDLKAALPQFRGGSLRDCCVFKELRGQLSLSLIPVQTGEQIKVIGNMPLTARIAIKRSLGPGARMDLLLDRLTASLNVEHTTAFLQAVFSLIRCLRRKPPKLSAPPVAPIHVGGISHSGSTVLASPTSHDMKESRSLQRSSSADWGDWESKSLDDVEVSDEEEDTIDDEDLTDSHGEKGHKIVPSPSMLTDLESLESRSLLNIRVNALSVKLFVKSEDSSAPAPASAPTTNSASAAETESAARNGKEEKSKGSQSVAQSGYQLELHGLRIGVLTKKNSKGKEKSMNFALPWVGLRSFQTNKDGETTRDLLGPSNRKHSSSGGAQTNSKIENFFDSSELCEMLSDAEASVNQKVEALCAAYSQFERFIQSKPIQPSATGDCPSHIPSFLGQICGCVPPQFPEFEKFTIASASLKEVADLPPFFFDSASGGGATGGSGSGSGPELFRLRWKKRPDSKELEARVHGLHTLIDFPKWVDLLTKTISAISPPSPAPDAAPPSESESPSAPTPPTPTAVKFSDRSHGRSASASDSLSAPVEVSTKQKIPMSVVIQLSLLSASIPGHTADGSPRPAGSPGSFRATLDNLLLFSAPNLERSRAHEDGDMLYILPPPRFLGDSMDYRRLTDAWNMMAKKQRLIVHNLRLDTYTSLAPAPLPVLLPFSAYFDMASDKGIRMPSTPNSVITAKIPNTRIELSNYQLAALLNVMCSALPLIQSIPSSGKKKANATTATVSTKKMKQAKGVAALLRLDGISLTLKPSQRFSEPTGDVLPPLLTARLSGLELQYEKHPALHKSVVKFRLRQIDAHCGSKSVPSDVIATTSTLFQHKFSPSPPKVTKNTCLLEMRLERPLKTSGLATEGGGGSPSLTSPPAVEPRLVAVLNGLHLSANAGNLISILDFVNSPENLLYLSPGDVLAVLKGRLKEAKQKKDELESGSGETGAVSSTERKKKKKDGPKDSWLIDAALSDIYFLVLSPPPTSSNTSGGGSIASTPTALCLSIPNLTLTSSWVDREVVGGKALRTALGSTSGIAPMYWEWGLTAIGQTALTTEKIKFQICVERDSPQSRSDLADLSIDISPIRAKLSPGHHSAIAKIMSSQKEVWDPRKKEFKAMSVVRTAMSSIHGPIIASLISTLGTLLSTLDQPLATSPAATSPPPAISPPLSLTLHTTELQETQQSISIEWRQKETVVVETQPQPPSSLATHLQLRLAGGGGGGGSGSGGSGSTAGSSARSSLDGSRGGRISFEWGSRTTNALQHASSMSTMVEPSAHEGVALEGTVQIADRWFLQSKLKFKKCHAVIQDDYLLAFKRKKDFTQAQQGPRYVVHLPSVMDAVRIDPSERKRMGLPSSFAIEITRSRHGAMILCVDTELDHSKWLEAVRPGGSLSARPFASSPAGASRSLPPDAPPPPTAHRKQQQTDEIQQQQQVSSSDPTVATNFLPLPSAGGVTAPLPQLQLSENVLRQIEDGKKRVVETRESLAHVLKQNEALRMKLDAALADQQRYTKELESFKLNSGSGSSRPIVDPDTQGGEPINLIGDGGASSGRSGSGSEGGIGYPNSEGEEYAMRIESLEQCVAQLTLEAGEIPALKHQIDEYKYALEQYKTMSTSLLGRITDKDADIQILLQERREKDDQIKALEDELTKYLVADSRLHSVAAKIKNIGHGNQTDFIQATEIQGRLLEEVRVNAQLRHDLEKQKEHYDAELERCRQEIIMLSGELQKFRQSVASLIGTGSKK